MIRVENVHSGEAGSRGCGGRGSQGVGCDGESTGANLVRSPEADGGFLRTVGHGIGISDQ